VDIGRNEEGGVFTASIRSRSGCRRELKEEKRENGVGGEGRKRKERLNISGNLEGKKRRGVGSNRKAISARKVASSSSLSALRRSWERGGVKGSARYLFSHSVISKRILEREKKVGVFANAGDRKICSPRGDHRRVRGGEEKKKKRNCHQRHFH